MFRHGRRLQNFLDRHPLSLIMMSRGLAVLASILTCPIVE